MSVCVSELIITPALTGRIEQAGFDLTVLPTRTLLQLRLHRAALDQAQAALPQLLVEKPLTATGNDPCALWLAPDTRLLVSQKIGFETLRQRIATALTDCLHACTNQSDALLALRLEGPGARRRLSSGCGLDFSEPAFPSGHCARTLFAQMPLLIHRPLGGTGFDLYIDRSYAASLWSWLGRQTL